MEQVRLEGGWQLPMGRQSLGGAAELPKSAAQALSLYPDAHPQAIAMCINAAEAGVWGTHWSLRPLLTLQNTHGLFFHTRPHPQTAMQPGLEYVLGDLLEFEDSCKGAEFYMLPVQADLAGGKFTLSKNY